jgi:hypothetical protein
MKLVLLKAYTFLEDKELLEETSENEIIFFQDLQLHHEESDNEKKQTSRATTTNSRTTTTNNRTTQEDEFEADEFVFNLNSDETFDVSLDYDIEDSSDCDIEESQDHDIEESLVYDIEESLGGSEDKISASSSIRAAAILLVTRSRKRSAEGKTQGGRRSKRSRF